MPEIKEVELPYVPPYKPPVVPTVPKTTPTIPWYAKPKTTPTPAIPWYAQPFTIPSTPPFFEQPWYTRPEYDQYTQTTSPGVIPLRERYFQEMPMDQMILRERYLRAKETGAPWPEGKSIYEPEGSMMEYMNVLRNYLQSANVLPPPTTPTTPTYGWLGGRRRGGGGGGFSGGGGYALPDWMTGLFQLNANR